MKWYIYTKENAPFEFEYHLAINSITEEELLAKFETFKNKKIVLDETYSIIEYIKDEFDDLELADDFYEKDWYYDVALHAGDRCAGTGRALSTAL